MLLARSGAITMAVATSRMPCAAVSRRNSGASAPPAPSGPSGAKTTRTAGGLSASAPCRCAASSFARMSTAVWSGGQAENGASASTRRASGGRSSRGPAGASPQTGTQPCSVLVAKAVMGR